MRTCGLRPARARRGKSLPTGPAPAEGAPRDPAEIHLEIRRDGRDRPDSTAPARGASRRVGSQSKALRPSALPGARQSAPAPAPPRQRPRRRCSPPPRPPHSPPPLSHRLAHAADSPSGRLRRCGAPRVAQARQRAPRPTRAALGGCWPDYAQLRPAHSLGPRRGHEGPAGSEARQTYQIWKASTYQRWKASGPMEPLAGHP